MYNEPQDNENASFEHINSKITPERDGAHILYMEYRARNGFGGMVVHEAKALVNNATCNVTVLSFQ